MAEVGWGHGGSPSRQDSLTDPPGSCVPQGPSLGDPEVQYTPPRHHSLSRADEGGGLWNDRTRSRRTAPLITDPPHFPGFLGGCVIAGGRGPDNSSQLGNFLRSEKPPTAAHAADLLTRLSSNLNILRDFRGLPDNRAADAPTRASPATPHSPPPPSPADSTTSLWPLPPLPSRCDPPCPHLRGTYCLNWRGRRLAPWRMFRTRTTSSS